MLRFNFSIYYIGYCFTNLDNSHLYNDTSKYHTSFTHINIII